MSRPGGPSRPGAATWPHALTKQKRGSGPPAVCSGRGSNGVRSQAGFGARPRGFPSRDLETRERGGLGWELLRDVFTWRGLRLGCPCPCPRPLPWGESKSQACGPHRQPASAFPSVTWEQRPHAPGVTVKDKQLTHTEVPGTGVTVQRPPKLAPSHRACPRPPSREASLPAQAVLPTPLGLRQREHRPAPHPALDPAQCPHASRHPGLCWGTQGLALWTARLWPVGTSLASSAGQDEDPGPHGRRGCGGGGGSPATRQAPGDQRWAQQHCPGSPSVKGAGQQPLQSLEKSLVFLITEKQTDSWLHLLLDMQGFQAGPPPPSGQEMATFFPQERAVNIKFSKASSALAKAMMKMLTSLEPHPQNLHCSLSEPTPRALPNVCLGRS